MWSSQYPGEHPGEGRGALSITRALPRGSPRSTSLSMADGHAKQWLMQRFMSWGDFEVNPL